MTAAIARKLWTTRRGLWVLIVLSIAAVVGMVYVLQTAMEADHVVERYGTRVVAPLDGTLCPGEELRFPVRLSVSEDNLPTILMITEGWWSQERRVILRSTTTTEYVPLVRPVELETTAVRIVPDVPAGIYYYDHVSQNGGTDAYTVGPITVRACAPSP